MKTMRFCILNRADKQTLKGLLSSYPMAIEDLKKQINILEEHNRKLQRIIEHYIPGKITGYSIKGHTEYVASNGIGSSMKLQLPDCLYVYKNGREYFFHGLYIDSPEFEQDSKLDNIIYAMSGDGNQHYILDLDTLKGIKYTDYSKEKE